MSRVQELVDAVAGYSAIPLRHSPQKLKWMCSGRVDSTNTRLSIKFRFLLHELQCMSWTPHGVHVFYFIFVHRTTLTSRSSLLWTCARQLTNDEFFRCQENGGAGGHIRTNITVQFIYNRFFSIFICPRSQWKIWCKLCLRTITFTGWHLLIHQRSEIIDFENYTENGNGRRANCAFMSDQKNGCKLCCTA